MTNHEIREKMVWRDANEARLECFSQLFGQKVEVRVLTTGSERLADRSVATINDFLALTQPHFDQIQQLLWQDCQQCCNLTSYGFDVPDGPDEAQINQQEFGVHNPDDAWQKSTLVYLLVIEEYQQSYPSNYGLLTFDNEWNGALTVVVMKNGRIVGSGDSGLYIGQFEQAD